MAFKIQPIGFLAALTVLAWGVFALAAAILGQIHLLSLVAAVLTTGILIAWPFLDGSATAGAPAMLQVHTCKDCGRSVRPAEAFGFCIRCGSVKLARGTGLAFGA